jgi:hypothetical protein
LSAIAIVDAGPLYAAADESDASHEAVLGVLRRTDLHFVVPTLAVAEASYMVGRRLGARAEVQFLRGIAAFDIEASAQDDWQRIAELAETYVDFPLGGTDASVVALAERLDSGLLVTLDRRHFAAVRPRHCPAFHLLPE